MGRIRDLSLYIRVILSDHHFVEERLFKRFSLLDVLLEVYWKCSFQVRFLSNIISRNFTKEENFVF
jgi:hypothetical protein